MGKSTINEPFSKARLIYQRVSLMASQTISRMSATGIPLDDTPLYHGKTIDETMVQTKIDRINAMGRGTL